MEGGVAGGVPPHKGSRLRPTAQKATRLVDDGILSGEVEIDETCIGVDERNRRRD